MKLSRATIQGGSSSTIEGVEKTTRRLAEKIRNMKKEIGFLILSCPFLIRSLAGWRSI